MARAGGTAGSARRSGPMPRHLRERVGDPAALAVCRASEDAVRGIGSWCDAQEVDAWYRAAPMLRVASTKSQIDSWEPVVRAARELGAPDEVVDMTAEEVRSRCDSALFLGGARFRLNATVHPARLALGLRAKLLERGARIHERTQVTDLDDDGAVETRSGRVRAGAAVLAVNARTSSFAGYRLSLAAASSHIVLTEPIPEVIEQIGWTGGEAVVDSRTLVHYMRTTNDGRIAFGWGGGTMGFDGRVSRRQEVDARVIRAHSRVTRPLLPPGSRPPRDARVGRADRRLPHALPDLRQPRPRPSRFRLHRERRRADLPRRRDPLPARARPKRRANRARDRRAATQALSAGALPLRRRLAHQARLARERCGRGRRSGARAGDRFRRRDAASPRPAPASLAAIIAA